MRIFINCEDCGREETQLRTEEKCDFVIERNLSPFTCNTEFFDGRSSVGTCQKCFAKRQEVDDESNDGGLQRTDDDDAKKGKKKVHWV